MTFATRCVLNAIALAFLNACGGGGSGDTTVPPQGNAPAEPSNATYCADHATAHNGDYFVENNVWNKGAVTSYRQCVGIAAGADGVGVDAEWEWNWPTSSSGVVSAPEVIYGQKPWFATTTPKLPKIVDEVKTARAQFGYQNVHNGSGNLTFDIWLTSSNVKPTGADHLPLKHELMIWLESWGGLMPQGLKVDTVSIDGVNWDLYVTQADWGPAPWQYLAYYPVSTVPRPFNIDVRKFLDHLKARRLISGQEWLASIEVGNEVAGGQGRTKLSSFNVTVE